MEHSERIAINSGGFAPGKDGKMEDIRDKIVDILFEGGFVNMKENAYGQAEKIMGLVERKTKTKKLPSIKSLKSKAWKLMSYKTRFLSANYQGNCFCVTCKTAKHWKEIHAGHFIHASKGSLASYDNRNIHPQCPKCNTYQGGNLIEYTLFIQGKYGSKVVDELRQMKQTIMKRVDFEMVIERLEKEIKRGG